MPIEDYFTPGSREWYEAKLYGVGNGNASVGANANALAETALGIAPGSGEAMAARDAWQASGRGANALAQGQYGQAAGEYVNMLAAAAGAIPGAGVIARGTKRGAAWMERNLPKGINALADRMMPSDPGSTTFIFAGPTAKTADHAALARAQEMADAGTSRDDIWSQTGWFQGADGKWRFEIPDNASVDVSPMRTGINSTNNRADRMLYHPEYYKAYPDAADMRVQFLREAPDAPYKGMYYDGKGWYARGDTPEARRSVSLHEMQHDAQAREGFATGGSIEEFVTHENTYMKKLYDAAQLVRSRMDNLGETAEVAATYIGKAPDVNIDPETLATLAKQSSVSRLGEFKKSHTPSELYKRLAGEVEARNVQTRQNMNALERRARAPWITQDVPDTQQLVRFK